VPSPSRVHHAPANPPQQHHVQCSNADLHCENQNCAIIPELHETAGSRTTIAEEEERATIVNRRPLQHHRTTTPEQPRCHAQPREGEECESETLILDRDSLRHVSCCYWTVKLVNNGQLVKASSQLWSKLQKWLNKRGKIGN